MRPRTLLRKAGSGRAPNDGRRSFPYRECCSPRPRGPLALMSSTRSRWAARRERHLWVGCSVDRAGSVNRRRRRPGRVHRPHGGRLSPLRASARHIYGFARTCWMRGSAPWRSGCRIRRRTWTIDLGSLRLRVVPRCASSRFAPTSISETSSTPRRSRERAPSTMAVKDAHLLRLLDPDGPPLLNDLLARPERSGRRDLNPRPPAPKAGALPSCATPRVARVYAATDGARRAGPPVLPYFRRGSATTFDRYPASPALASVITDG